MLLGKQRVSRPFFDRVRQIRNHRIPGFIGLLQKILRIVNNQLNPRIIKGVLMHFRQIFTAGFDDFPVNIHHDHPFDIFPTQHFADRCAFGPTKDQNFFWIPMQYQWGMDNAFVIDKFINGGRLPFAIEHQALAVRAGLNDIHLLELGFPIGQDRIGPMGVNVVGGDDFIEPKVSIESCTGHVCSINWTAHDFSICSRQNSETVRSNALVQPGLDRRDQPIAFRATQ